MNGQTSSFGPSSTGSDGAVHDGSGARGPALSATNALALILIVLVAVGFRLYRIDAPLVDAHSWRQVTNADIARHFTEGSLNIFEPRVSWGGDAGLVGMEFPLLQWITGALWRVTGESSRVARGVATGFSIVTVVLMNCLGRRLHSPAAGYAAALLTAVSPGLVFFGRSFLSDTPMVTFSVAAVLAWDWYLDKPLPRRALVASVMTALAGLVKLPAILVLGAIAGLAWQRQGLRSSLRDRWLLSGVLAALVLIVGWYYYADLIFRWTGLTQAVFRPSGTYPPDIAPGVSFVTVSHFSTMARLGDAEFWREITDRLWNLYLTPVGALAAIVGVGIAAGLPKAWGLHLWTLAGAALVLVAAEGQYWHEFHTLPLIPPLVLYAGIALAPVFAAMPTRRVAAVCLALAIGVGAVQAFRGSGVITKLYRAEAEDARFVALGDAVREGTIDAPMITVDYLEGGANSPMLLYFAHRQGWSFDVHSISRTTIDHLTERLGARYFVTPIWRELSAGQPEVAAFLEGYKSLALSTSSPDFRAFDLSVRVQP